MAGKFKILSAGEDSKGLNIFKSSSYKPHLQKPMAQLFWRIRWATGIWLGCALAFGIAFAVEHLWRYGMSPATAKWMSVYFENMFFSGGLSVLAEIPDWLQRTLMRTDIACICPLIPIIVYHFLAHATLIEEFNPHGKDKFKEKSSNKATEEDIKQMGTDYKNKNGLFSGFMMVLGYFKKKPLMFDECLSALCVAPPGAGKTAGVVVPTILECDSVSMIINDPKPELKQQTSAYRATVGPVFIMNWAGQDNPENGIYYPSWNPLSPEHVPTNSEQRDLYIDSMCNILIAEKASSSADPHWTLSGRSALSGLIQFIVSKIERAKANDYFYSRIEAGTFDAEDAAVLSDYYTSMMNDPNAYAALSLLRSGQMNAMNYVHIGTWANIPDAWRGKEASLSMLLDWQNASQIQIADSIENRRKEGDQMVMLSDPMKDLFLNAVNEARQYSYAHRAVLELTQLANTPDKERGSILSTVMTGLGIFRNAAVRNRTSHSDFHLSDLRGMRDPRDGKIKPVSVYLSINMVDAEALNPITGIFIELMSNFLLANAPNATNSLGQKMGPCPVLFVLDEMPKMQKLQAVIQGPDLGRGQKISYLIIGQDIHQISEKYGNDAASTIISTTAAKIIMRQNDPDTAKRFSEMIGNKMKIKITTDDKGKEVETPEEELLYTPMDLMKLPTGKQVVLIQGYYNRPIEADQERHFLRKNDVQIKLDDKVKMGEASPLPEFLIPLHHAVMGYGGIPKIYNPKTNEIKILSA
ncbi:MAG: type IV secretory system conjugative DNA transfer family protein [Rickettsiales bacterium]|jgi:type IV secretion system protein VirD4|nr:type IV secretory system conjugative DNA transfer family protein [Rickettsiales bacterium]